MGRTIALGLLLLFSWISCKKGDTNVVEDIVELSEDTDMRIEEYNITLYSPSRPNPPDEFDLDINSDEVNDIRLIMGNEGSLGSGDRPIAKIQSLYEGVSFHGFFKSDTAFTNTKKEFKELPDGIIEVEVYYTRSCTRLEENDVVGRIEEDQFKVIASDTINHFSSSDVFLGGSFTLNTVSYSTPRQIIGEIPDTIIFNYFDYLNNCNTFPLNEDKYIGIKLTENGEEKLGWVKLNLPNQNEMILLETGIKK